MPEDVKEQPPEQKPDPFKGATAKVSDQIRKRAEGYIQTYANSVALEITSWDFAILFGRIVGKEEEKAVIEETVKVTLTREAAKVFHHILGTHLKNYEALFGEIRVPTATDIETIKPVLG